MLQHEKLKTLQQITGLVINFFQNNQNFDSGEKSTSKHTDLTSNQTETRILCFIIKCVKTVKFNVIYLTKSLSLVILHCESSLFCLLDMLKCSLNLWDRMYNIYKYKLRFFQQFIQRNKNVYMEYDGSILNSLQLNYMY